MLLALCLISACSNVEVPDLDADVRSEKIIPPNWKPLPLRVGLAPVRRALEVTEKETNVEGGKRWVLNADDDRLNRKPAADDAQNKRPTSLHHQLMGTLAHYRMFDSIEEIKGATPESDDDELQSLALKQGIDLIMLPAVRRHDVGYVGSNDMYGWNLVLWWMVSPIITFWVADEDYDAHLHIDLRLIPVAGNAELPRTRLQPPQKVIRSLDDVDEGWCAYSIYDTPGHFNEDNWKNIGDLLMPIAENEAKKAALRFVTIELAKQAATDDFKAAIRRRVALVIGVDGTGQPPLPLTRFAVNDAQTFAEHIVNAGNEPTPSDAVKVLTGPLATQSAVTAAANELSRLARGNDDVIFYFSGVGMLEGGQPAIALSRPGGTEYRPVALEKLLDLLTANKPRTLTIVLDCSFTAPGGARCATSADEVTELRNGGRAGCLLVPIIKRIEERGTECLVLTSSGAQIDAEQPMPALEIEDLKHGLFSSFTIQGLRGDADTGEDEGLEVSALELRNYVQAKVTHIAKLEGQPQTGWFYLSPRREGYILPSQRAE